MTREAAPPVDPHGPSLRPGRRNLSERAESRAAIAALLGFAVTAVAVAAVGWGGRAPLSGQGSIGTHAAWLTAGTTAVAFLVSFVGTARDGGAEWRRELPLIKRIIDLVALTAAVAAVSALGIEALAALFQAAFVGLTVDPLGGGALAGAASAALTYFASGFGSRVTTEGIAVLATSTLFIGTLASMLSSPDARWWELHFSQLGNQQGESAAAFNSSLILAGLVIIAIADYAAHDVGRGLRTRGEAEGLPAAPLELRSAERSDRTASPDRTIARRTAITAWLFIAIGIMMCIAGLVHDAVNSFVHVGAASGMVVAFGLLAIFTLFGLPGLPHGYRALTIGVLLGTVVAILLWIPLGYYNLTGVEFISAGLIFAWFIVFTRIVGAYAEHDPDLAR